MRKLLICFVALAFAFTAVPAMAAEQTIEERVQAIEECIECMWTFYGSVRMSTFWDDVDAGDTVTGAAPAPGNWDDGDLTWDFQNNSRIGANVKIGDISGKFEYGHSDEADDTTLRVLSATWNFGSGSLLIGHDYNPIWAVTSDQVYGGDADMMGYGQISGLVRLSQIKLTMGGFQFALAEPENNTTDILTDTNPALAGDAVEMDTELPMLLANYRHAFGPVNFAIFGGYNAYEVNYQENDADPDVEGTEYSYDIDSYMLGLQFGFAQGPFSANLSGWMGENVFAFGALSAVAITPVYGRVATTAGDIYEWDTDDWGFSLDMGFKVNDMLTFKAGYGYVESELDAAYGGNGIGAGTNQVYEDDAQTWYLNAKIQVAKGFFIQPEIGMIDRDDQTQEDGADNYVSYDEGDTTYFGAKWQIDF